jgi:hypothetical protein
VYTLLLIPMLIFGLNNKLNLQFIFFFFLILAYTLLIAINFERRDLAKNEFDLSRGKLNETAWRLKKISAELLIAITLFTLTLFFFFNLISALFSLLIILFTVYCISKSSPTRSWHFYDLLLDSILLLSAMPFLLIYFFK